MSSSPVGRETDAENGEVLHEQMTAEEGEEVTFVDDHNVYADEESGGNAESIGHGHVHFKDHFTLKNPSGTVRFRGSNVRVLEQRNSQIILEEHAQKDDETQTQVLIKKVKNERAFGLNFLRFVYILFCLLFSGILFIFCFLVLLFLFMGLVPSAQAAGDDSKQILVFLGTLFAIPMFIYGLASAMAIAGTFVSDTWSGHMLLRTLGNFSLIFTEWAAFFVFLGIPVLVGIITLFMGLDDWWEVMTLSWFCCMGLYYVFFASTVIYYEVDATFGFVREMDSNASEGWQGLLRRAILFRMVHHLSGVRKHDRMTNIKKEEETPYDNEFFHDLNATLYSRMTLNERFFGRFYDKVDPPERLYSPQEILGTRQFVTSTTWSLEKIFCTRNRTQMVNVVRGPSALLPSQMRSSFACAIVGSLLAIVFFIAMVVWSVTGYAPLLVLVIAILYCFIPHMRSTKKIYNMYQDVRHAQEEELDADEHDGVDRSTAAEETEGIYQTFETYRVTRPTVCLCWTVFSLEVVIFIVWPVIVLFVTENYPVGVVFLVVSIVSMTRIYFDPAILIAEMGSFDIINPEEEEETTTTRSVNMQWKSKYRLSTILLNITRGPTTSAWAWIFALLALMVIIYSGASLAKSPDDSTTKTENLVLLPSGNFAYEPQTKMPYPSCQLLKGLEIPGSNSTALIDYVFLAAVAYESSDSVQNRLDQWFGPGVAVDEVNVVENFRQEVPGGQAAVSYRLVSFPSVNSAIVVVRGSTTSWEWLTNAQLWSAAAVAQVVRFLLPAGELFTPILDELLLSVSWVQSKGLQKVALYKQTTSFVEAIKASGNYITLQITGHSLGGGIAIITGAQTGIPAVAVSGPNALLSRRTFDPPVTEEALNTNIFNIVPDRDMVPRVDDLADLYQRIQCRGPKNNFWACHSITRTLCDISFQCGTGNRPALCACATEKGYPEPDQFGGSATFTDLCGTQRSNM